MYIYLQVASVSDHPPVNSRVCVNKVEAGVHSSTLSLYGNSVAMNEVRNRVGSSNTLLKYQQQSYWKKIPCG